MELKEKVKAALVESLNEDVYKVDHEGHPDADKVKELSHLKPGKKYTNHITKYPDSAKKAAAMLKKNGFQGVKIYKNWKLMEDVELDESNLTPSSIKVKIIKNGDKHELTIRQPNRKVTGYHKSFDSREDAEKFVHMKWGNDALQEETELDEAKDPFAGTPWSAKKTKEKLLNDVKKRIGMDKPETKDPKSVVKDGKRVFESIDLEEGKMAELHADIGDHMDKHIGEYKRAGGAEALMAHAAKASHKIAKMHGMEHKHAEKFVSSYIDSKLNEETLNEGYGSKVLAFKMLVNKFKKPKADTSDAMDDVYAKAKAHVAKKHPGYKLASLGRGKNSEINYEVLHPKTGVSKEGVIKEETLDEAVSPKHDAAIAELSKLGYTVKHERTEPSGLRKTWMGRPTRHDSRTDDVINKHQTTRTQFTKQTDHDVYIGSYDRKKKSA